MEPYQKSAEALKSGEEYPLQLLKNAGLTALGGGIAAAGSKALNKLIPAVGALINNYVPENLSRAGLTKIDPRFGKFIQGALDEGYTYDELREFIGDKIEKSEVYRSSKENKNIIEQYSPELHSFISEEIKKGRPTLQAGALAQLNDKFKKVIKKIEEDHKTSFSAILQSSYGEGTSKGMSKEEATKRFLGRKKSNLPNELIQQFEGRYGPIEQQGQTGPGQQALMATMQKIMQQLGQ